MWNIDVCLFLHKFYEQHDTQHGRASNFHTVSSDYRKTQSPTAAWPVSTPKWSTYLSKYANKSLNMIISVQQTIRQYLPQAARTHSLVGRTVKGETNPDKRRSMQCDYGQVYVHIFWNVNTFGCKFRLIKFDMKLSSSFALPVSPPKQLSTQ